MNDKIKAVELKNYTESAFEVESIHLHFELGFEQTTVFNHMVIHKSKPSASQLVLDGRDLELQSIRLNGRLLNTVDYQIEDETLTLLNVPDVFTLDIITITRPSKNHSLLGLYQSRDMICTQCEANGFRKITYYLDRPDVLSIFTTSINADAEKFPVLLSNGNPMYKKNFGQKQLVIWHDPFKKPSYLFALVAGQLACVKDGFITRSNRHIDIHLYTEPHYKDKCQFAIDVLKRSMKWDEDTYNREYDLDLFMLVAVSDFNMGAMENKGLNIFNVSCIIADKAISTDYDYIRVETVVAHEYFHNWTGNRVTCKNWFQLSLKEGLTVFREQQYAEDMYPEGVNRIDNIQHLIHHQFPEDKSPLAHPVMPKSYAEINNFYTQTVYSKGAELIWMLHHMLGKAVFQKGMDIYFDTHDGKAVSIEDFIHAMGEASGRDLTSFLKWYDQIGTLKLHVRWDKKASTLQLEQQPPSQDPKTTNYPLTLPFQFSFIDDKRLIESKANGKASRTHQIVLNQMKETVKIDVKPEAILTLHNHFTAPIEIEYAYTFPEVLETALSDVDDYTRFHAAHKAHEMALKALEDKKPLPDGYLTFFEQILAQDIKASLMSYLISIPSVKQIMDRMGQIDVDQALGLHEMHLSTLLEVNMPLFSKKYLQLQNNDSAGCIDSNAMAERSLKHTLLQLMSHTKSRDVITWIEHELASSNMTDQLAGLSALSVYDFHEAKPYYEAFYQRHQHEDLIMTKWFSQVARIRNDAVYDYIDEVVKKDAFDMRNPNKVRAVYGAFSMDNMKYFHSKSGQGYHILTEIIRVVDKNNPQLSSRLVQSYAPLRQFKAPWSDMMAQELKQLSQQPGLSKDLAELTFKLIGS